MEKPGIPLVEAFKMMQVNEEDSPVENGEAIHEEVCFCTLKCHMCKTIDFLCLFIASNSVIWDFSAQFVRDYANYCPPDCFTCMRNKAGTVWTLYLLRYMQWVIFLGGQPRRLSKLEGRLYFLTIFLYNRKGMKVSRKKLLNKRLEKKRQLRSKRMTHQMVQY
jgi:hypothetical protein